jgi:parallel beta-helix repeat protein
VIKHAAYPSTLLLILTLSACGGGSGGSGGVEQGRPIESNAQGISVDAQGPALTAANHLYVATTGSDSNPGTQSAPLKTIVKASQVAKPDTIVHVAPGSYAGGFQTTKSGTATGRIRFISDVKWGAKIRGGSGSAAWDNRANYIDIDGFEVDGSSTSWREGIYMAGSYGTVKNSYVHHIGNSGCTNTGGSAINSDHYYYGEKNDIINNVVHDIGSPGCSFIQGIYMASSGDVINNLVYNVGAVAIHLWHDAANIKIINNTVFNSEYGMVIGGGDFTHSSGPADNIVVSNNIVFDNTYGISEQGSVGTHNTYTNNLVYQNRSYNISMKTGVATGTIAANPLFVNYVRTGGGDYRLTSASPAIDAGSSTYAPAVDLNGSARTKGAAVDIGAYEYKG